MTGSWLTAFGYVAAGWLLFSALFAIALLRVGSTPYPPDGEEN